MTYWVKNRRDARLTLIPETAFDSQITQGFAIVSKAILKSNAIKNSIPKS